MSGRLLGPRAQAALVLMFVAGVGALGGIVGDRLIAQQSPAAIEPDGMQRPPGNPLAGPGTRMRGDRGSMRMPGYAERLGTLIDLSPDQQVAIDSIVAEERRRVRELTRELEPRFREITQQTRTRVESVLTAEQVEHLREIRQQRARMLREQAPGQRPPGMRQRMVPPDSLD